MLLFLVACDPLIETVSLTGIVQDAPSNAGNPVASAAVSSRNRDGDEIGTATTESDGSFAVDVPAGTAFYLEVSADGYVPTAFSSYSGTANFEASAGYPWIATTTWVDDLRATYAACPTVNDEGAIITGEVLAMVEGIDDPNSWPGYPDSVVTGVGSNATEIPACYLDDSGVSSADLAGTGIGGEYAVFGLPAGSAVLDVTAERNNGEIGTDAFDFIVPEGGLVPVYPTPLQL